MAGCTVFEENAESATRGPNSCSMPGRRHRRERAAADVRALRDVFLVNPPAGRSLHHDGRFGAVLDLAGEFVVQRRDD